MTDDDALIARIHAAYSPNHHPVAYEAADRIAALTATVAEQQRIRDIERGQRLKAEERATKAEAALTAECESSAHLLVLASDRAERAEAALAERDKDAERYRWLRSPRRTNKWAISRRRADDNDNWYTVDCAEYLDAAIDAAIAAQEKPS